MEPIEADSKAVEHEWQHVARAQPTLEELDRQTLYKERDDTDLDRVLDGAIQAELHRDHDGHNQDVSDRSRAGHSRVSSHSRRQ